MRFGINRQCLKKLALTTLTTVSTTSKGYYSLFRYSFPIINKHFRKALLDPRTQERKEQWMEARTNTRILYLIVNHRQ
jgi:hypothetical protein